MEVRNRMAELEENFKSSGYVDFSEFESDEWLLNSSMWKEEGVERYQIKGKISAAEELADQRRLEKVADILLKQSRALQSTQSRKGRSKMKDTTKLEDSLMELEMRINALSSFNEDHIPLLEELLWERECLTKDLSAARNEVAPNLGEWLT